MAAMLNPGFSAVAAETINLPFYEFVCGLARRKEMGEFLLMRRVLGVELPRFEQVP
jgi:hypothetical protein